MSAPRVSVLVLPAVLVAAASAPAAEGDVQAFVDRQGTLIVRGDNLDNQVFVGRTGENGEFEVVGEGTTTINGQASAILVSESVSIFLRGGNDRVRVDGNIGGDVVVDGGAGDDFLALGDPAIEGSALLSGGAGNDTLTAEDTAVALGLRMRGGSGDDALRLGFVSLHERLVIEGGAGDDDVQLFQAHLDGFLRVDAGPGADTCRVLSESMIDGRAVIVMASGDDEVEIDEGVFGDALLVAVGSGTDSVRVALTEVVGDASFHGGPQRDSFDDAGGNVFVSGPPHVEGFEKIAEL